MDRKPVDACVPVQISDEDIYAAMEEIVGYLDITPGDFKEVYLKAYSQAIRRLTRSMAVSEVMTETVVTVSRSTPLKDVAAVMAERGIAGVPVVEDDGTVVGVLSEKDFLNAMGAGTRDSFMEVISACLGGKGCLAAPARAQSAQDIMTAPAITLPETASVLEAAELLTRKGINRLPVVDAAGRIVGIVSRADVVRSSLT